MAASPCGLRSFVARMAERRGTSLKRFELFRSVPNQAKNSNVPKRDQFETVCVQFGNATRERPNELFQTWSELFRPELGAAAAMASQAAVGKERARRSS